MVGSPGLKQLLLAGLLVSFTPFILKREKLICVLPQLFVPISLQAVSEEEFMSAFKA